MSQLSPLGPVYLDATVLSNFASSDGLSLLDEIDAEIRVVAAVREKLEAGADRYSFLHRALDSVDSTFESVSNCSEADGSLTDIFEQLDYGEAHVVAVALDTDSIAATDDQDARRVAKAHDIRVTGSLGLLARAVHEGLLSTTQADIHLRTWITDAGYYSPVDSIESVL